jgi:hypothetical protein
MADADRAHAGAAELGETLIRTFYPRAPRIWNFAPCGEVVTLTLDQVVGCGDYVCYPHGRLQCWTLQML